MRARAQPVRGQGASHLESHELNPDDLSPEEADGGRDQGGIVMEYHRKQAKALVHAYRAGDAEAIRRAAAVLGVRARERFLLSDAQHVVAREAGFPTWAEMKHAGPSRPAWIEGENVEVPTDLRHGAHGAVEVTMRKRGWRFDLSDGGHAVEFAGRPRGWGEVAQRVVDEYALNLNRRGVVFVQSNESRLDRLLSRIAECSVALYEELLDCQPESP